MYACMHAYTHTHTHTLSIIVCISSTHRKMSKPTTGAAGNRTKTNPYLTPADVPVANKQPKMDNIELEADEELYQDVH